MSINTNESSAGDMNSGDDFVKLDFIVEHIEFDAIGEMSEELIEELELAKANLNKTPCPPSVRIRDIRSLGAVDLCHYGHGLFGLTIGGMRVEIMQRKGRWIATIHGGSPHAPDENHLAELEDKVRRTKEYLFGKEGQVKLKACAVTLYCHLNPDPSDTESNEDTFEDLAYGHLTRARCSLVYLRLPGSSKNLVSYLFGSTSGGRQVRLSAWGGRYSPCSRAEAYASPSDTEAYARLMENSQYQKDREIIGVKLIYQPPFIDLITRGIKAKSSELNLSDLLRELVRATLGDETLPPSFFRVVTMESLYSLPEHLRPNSAAWERVRRAFLEGMPESK